MAQVLIFSTVQESTALTLNRQPIGNLAGTGPGNRYAPSPPLAVDRSQMPEPGRFGSGLGNVLQLSRPGGSTQILNVEIGHNVHPAIDLQLWIFSNYAVLVAGGDESVYELRRAE